MIKKTVLILMVMLIPDPAYTANEQWSTYGVEDGLPIEYVRTVAADKAGNAWFGFGEYWNGIAVFNREVRTFTAVASPLEGCRVKDIAVDSSGTVWCLTDEGRLLYYRGQLWGELPLDESLKDLEFRQLITDREGSLWLAGNGGVIRYDGTDWKKFTAADGLLSSNVYALTLDINGLIWCSTDSSIAVFAGAGWLSFTTLDGLPQGGYGVISSSLDGSIWASTQDEKILLISPARVITYGVEQWGNGVPRGKSLCMQVGSDGQIWICGSYRYGEDGKGYTNFDGKDWQKYVYPDKNTHSTVMDIALDSLGNLWFATLGSGVRKLGELDGLRTYTVEDGLPYNQFDHICSNSKGNIWLGAYDGESILRFDENRWFTYSLADSQGLESTSVYALATDSMGHLWCGTVEGLQKYDGQKWETYFRRGRYDLITWVYELLVDSRDNLWVGTQGGVRKWDGWNWTFYNISNGLANNVTYSIAQDSRGDMWFGSLFGHLSRFDGTKWTTYSVTDSSSSHAIRNITADNGGNVFISIDGVGIKRYDGSDWTVLSGLPTTWSNSIAMDSLGNLWSGSNLGLAMWDGIKWVTQGEESGLLKNIHAIETDSRGNLWIAADIGLSSLNPAFEIKQADLPVPNENEEINSAGFDTVRFPKVGWLHQNYPNPFNPSTTITYSLPEKFLGKMSLKIYDVRGRLVRTLVEGPAGPGFHSTSWSGDDGSGRQLGSGVYFYRLVAGKYSQTRKMIILK